MSNNKKRLQVAQAQVPPNIAGQLVITAFTDRKPTFQCSGDVIVALRLMAVGIQTVIQALEQQALANAQADPVDKKREYLGPREKVKVYDKEG